MNFLITATVLFLGVPETMPVESVQRGQRGVCLTVFEGTEIEEMAFEVKGVMPKYLGPQSDLIVIKLLGEKPSFTGVVAGMSGSPCMVDGKVIGALGYSFASFAKEPIAGVTPIGGMLALLGLPREKMPWRQEERAASLQGFRKDSAAFKQGAFESSGVVAPEMSATRVLSPLGFSGMPHGVWEDFKPWADRMGWMPVASGGGSGVGAERSALLPGSAVAALLVRGDVNMAATGTVTWNDGGRVLAFGHPFMGHGAVSLPMAGAHIVNTMASSMRSFKMSVPTQVVGELVQDRSSAIAGDMGDSPGMVSVRGVLRAYGKTSSFAFEVARDVYLTPRLLAVALSGAMSGRVEASARGMLYWYAQVLMKGYPAVMVRDVAVAEQDGRLFSAAAMGVADVFAPLWLWPMAEAPPEMEVVVDAEYVAKPVVESVDRVTLERAVWHPGETVRLHASLVRPDTSRAEEVFEVPVPEAWLGRTLTVHVGSADAWLEHRFSEQRTGEPETFHDWIAQQQAQHAPSDKVYAWVTSDTVGLGHRGHAMTTLPPKVVASWKSDDTWVPLRKSVVWDGQARREGVVTGHVSVVFDVKQ